MAIGRHNRESLLKNPNNEEVLYALAHKKPEVKAPLSYVDEEEEPSFEKPKKRG